MIALQQHGPDSLVEGVMRQDFVSLGANEMLDIGLARIQEAECCMTAPVIDRDSLVGLLTAENVNEFLLIVSALGEQSHSHGIVPWRLGTHEPLTAPDRNGACRSPCSDHAPF